jgi:hypothetical protein
MADELDAVMMVDLKPEAKLGFWACGGFSVEMAGG